MSQKILMLLTPSVESNVMSESEHASEKERSSRVTKEKIRAECAILPFNCMSQLMIKKLVSFQILWLNAFPV